MPSIDDAARSFSKNARARRKHLGYSQAHIARVMKAEQARRPGDSRRAGRRNRRRREVGDMNPDRDLRRHAQAAYRDGDIMTAAMYLREAQRLRQKARDES